MTQIETRPAGSIGEPPAAEQIGSRIGEEEIAELARLVLANNGITVESDDSTSAIQAASRKGHLQVIATGEDYFKVDPLILLDAFRLGRMMGAPDGQSGVY
jgi:hypothetical protein